MKTIFKYISFLMILAAVAMLVSLSGCSNDPVGTAGTSYSGYQIAIRANPDQLRSNSSDTAQIMVEVWDKHYVAVDGATVTFSVTSGKLSASTATTTKGFATVIYTSGNTDATAIIAASVENIIAKAEIVQYYTTK